MGWKIPDDTIQDVRDRVSIVEVISGYVSLKRAGRNHIGLCPFHNEKTPSFTVSEERGVFHCFGCGAGGTVFSFLMRLEHVEFPEAVEMLARRVGIALPPRTGSEAQAGERERLVRINDWAAGRFAKTLWGPQGEEARRYLERRGVTREIAETFCLGYADPSGQALARSLEGRSAGLQAALQAGLISRRDGGGYYDRFRGRLMFPIADPRGRMVGFGGRTLGEAQPKYLNTAESPLFRKGELLYGLPQARPAMRARDQVVVVEGYLDVLALVQHGVANVVATLGTAATPAHFRLLRRLVSEIIVFFDGDTAGRAAAARAFAVCAEAGAWAKGAFLPEGEDPDTFVRQRGADAVQTLLAASTNLADFYFGRMRPRDDAPLAERARAAEEVARVLNVVKNGIERDMLLRRAAEVFGVREEVLRGQGAGGTVTARSARVQPAASTPPVGPPAEVQLVEHMAIDQDVARRATERGVISRFRNAELADYAERLVRAWEGNDAVAGVIDAMPEALASRISAALLGGTRSELEDRLRAAEDCMGVIEEAPRQEEVRATLARLRQARSRGDEEQERLLLLRYQELKQGQGIYR